MELGNQVGSAIVVSYILEWLKLSRFPLLSQLDTSKYKAFIGFFAALITTIGIHYTFDYDFDKGGQILFSLPPFTVAMHGVKDFLFQWAFQQASYDGFVKKGKPTEMVISSTTLSGIR